MSIETVQNKIKGKMGRAGVSTFTFPKCDNRDDFYQDEKPEEIEPKEQKLDILSEINNLEEDQFEDEDDSQIVDLNNMSEPEDEPEIPESKYLDIEAEEDSAITDYDVDLDDDFDYQRDIKNQEKLFLRFQKKYMKKKEKKAKKAYKIEDVEVSSSDSLQFEEIDENEASVQFEKEDSMECVENEQPRRFD